MLTRLLIVLLGFASVACVAQGVLPPDATLASIAHGSGVRGGDLAEKLGLERSVAKDRPLVEMGVTPDRLRQAMLDLGVAPEAVERVIGSAQVDLSMTLPQASQVLGMTGQALAHELGIPVDGMNPRAPMSRLGVTQAQLDQVVRHTAAEHESFLPPDWKYAGYALVVLFALLYLLRLGIPRGGDPKRRRAYYPNWVFVGVLLSSVIALGFLTGKSPNPMEGVVKVFKATAGLYSTLGPYLLAMAFFLALAVVANKAVCGWGCPFGALEELVYTLPLFRRAKRWQLPLWASNSVRLALFIAFLLVLYGLVGGRKGLVLYHYMNPFNLFSQDFSTRSVVYFTGAYLLLSFVFYRPFCRFICPFGLLSWVVERISLTRIRVDRERCIDCRACAKACPLTAARDRLDRKPLPADCFACMRCLRVCPTDAIHWRLAWGPPSPPSPEQEETEAA
jgi:ferredoxin